MAKSKSVTPTKETVKETMIRYLEANIDKSDTEIAKKLISDYPELATKYKNNFETLRKRLCSTRKDVGLPYHTDIKLVKKDDNIKIPDIIEEDRQIINLRTERTESKKKYEHLLKELDIANKRLNVVLDIKEAKTKIYEIPYNKRNKDDSQSVAFAIASDWHIGEIVDPATVNGLNEFNLEIGRKRVNKFFTSIIKLIEIERKGTHIDTLVLFLGGDMMTGVINEELLESTDLSPVETVIELRSMIVSGINLLKQECDLKKIIIPTAFGNHGRTTAKRRISTSSKNSYEWLLYNILKSDYINDPQVEFLVGSGYHNWITVFDKYPIRCHHGDSLQYYGGVGGLYIPVNKAISQWNKIRSAYLDIFGHFHQFVNGGNFICNSSLIGYNAFALSIKASYEEPKQTFFTIDKDRGLTAVRPIFVTEK